MKLPSLVILGLARNAGSGLEPSLQAVARICAASEGAQSIIITNDNTDGTDRVLEMWARSEPSATIVNCDGVAARFPQRIDRIAYLRNLALSLARKLHPRPMLLIVMDMDGLNAGIMPNDLRRSLDEAPDDWAGIFANQTGAYYDLYALRKPGWVTDRFWRAIQLKKRRGLAGLVERIAGRARRQRVREMVRRRQYTISPDLGFIPVQSAFGGLAIYAFARTDDAIYGSRDDVGGVICEHVIFNRMIAARGGRLFIHAALRNITPQDHFERDSTLSGLPIPLKLRR